MGHGELLHQLQARPSGLLSLFSLEAFPWLQLLNHLVGGDALDEVFSELQRPCISGNVHGASWSAILADGYSMHPVTPSGMPSQVFLDARLESQPSCHLQTSHKQQAVGDLSPRLAFLHCDHSAWMHDVTTRKRWACDGLPPAPYTWPAAPLRRSDKSWALWLLPAPLMLQHR